MLEILSTDAPHVVALRAGGRVTADELQRAIDAIEACKASQPRVSLYTEIDELRWMTATALLRDLGYGLTQLGELDHYYRAAIVTDKRWIRPIAEFENLLFKPLEVKVFATQDKDDAMDWVQQLPEGS